MQHATDSANTAGTLSTGHKASVNMISVDLYEDPVSTIVEDAMRCGKSGGVVTSVPLLHATPAAFVTHTNSRTNNVQLADSFKAVNPTYAAGTCSSSTSPGEKHKTSMLEGGSLSNQWTFLYQGKNNATAANLYDPIQSLDPDDDKHVLVCLGGQYTASKQINLPFRGLDSGYSNRWCSSATAVKDASGATISYIPNSKKCDHYSSNERAQIPVMSKNVEEALKFLSKDNEGFFMMYEQGDVSEKESF
jgi:alkaline phosphatase